MRWIDIITFLIFLLLIPLVLVVSVALWVLERLGFKCL
jgi:hypothetical protein